MTKREWLESVDFNNLTLKEKISKCFHFVDNMTVKQFRDRLDGEDEEEYNKLFKAEFTSVFEKYPSFKSILSELKRVNKLKGPDGKYLHIPIDEQIHMIHSSLLKEAREENLKKVIENENI